MPLTKAIQFSSLASQLTAAESVSFIKDVADSNHQIITDALSSYFRNLPPDDDRVTLNDQYIKSISTIIQSRDAQTEENSSITFDSLPRRLIGVCGSFLEQQSFQCLSRANRAIYLGCNTPIVLTELAKHYRFADELRLFNFSVFPFVKRLILKNDTDWDTSLLSVERMNVIAGQIAKMSQLQSLELFEVDAEFIGIIANHEETNRRTKYLYLRQQQMCTLARLSSITSFKHLQFLEVCLEEDRLDSECGDNLDIKAIMKMCSNLKGLDFYDSYIGIEMPVLQSIGHQLHYLKFYDLDQVAVSALKNVNFANLRQLVQGERCSDDSFRFMLKTALNVEKVKFRRKSELTMEILTQCKRLEYLEIECNDALLREKETTDNVLDHLDVMAYFFEQKNNALNDTLKIKLYSCLRDLSREQETKSVSNIERVVKSLSASKVDQWMITLDLFTRRAGFPISMLYKRIRRKLNRNSAVSRTRQVGDVFVITNPDCTIEGIAENWLMRLHF